MHLSRVQRGGQSRPQQQMALFFQYKLSDLAENLRASFCQQIQKSHQKNIACVAKAIPPLLYRNY